MANRKKATRWFIDTVIAKLDKDNRNIAMYEEYFDKLSDKEFDVVMTKLSKGDSVLPYYAFNMDKSTMNVANVLKVGDALGIEFFQQIYMTDPVTGVEYLTPEKYLIVDVPIRRQGQHLTKKKDVPDDDKVTDATTGQAVGPSKSAMMSLPEIMVLESAGHTSAIEELTKARGGDQLAYNHSKRQMIDSGSFTLKELATLGSKPTSTDTVKAFLLGMHFDNNI